MTECSQSFFLEPRTVGGPDVTPANLMLVVAGVVGKTPETSGLFLHQAQRGGMGDESGAGSASRLLANILKRIPPQVQEAAPDAPELSQTTRAKAVEMRRMRRSISETAARIEPCQSRFGL
jgi:hypothetical protein